MDWHICIEQRPEVLCGKPVFKGTRLSVQLVLERLADGWTTAGLLASFPTLRAEHIQAAVSGALQEESTR
jgi:uncharacterized protein (DUF433 family)